MAERLEAMMCEDCPPVGYPTEKTRCVPCPRRLSQGVINLVIAARRAFDLGYNDEEFRELDEALEAFSALVPYDPE